MDIYIKFFQVSPFLKFRGNIVNGNIGWVESRSKDVNRQSDASCSSPVAAIKIPRICLEKIGKLIQSTENFNSSNTKTRLIRNRYAVF